MKKMKPGIKARWIERLRSGKYKQGIETLHNPKNDRFCCLGVLCEMAVEDGIIKKRISAGRTVYGEQLSLLPTSVMRWAGVDGPYADVILDEADQRRLGVDRAVVDLAFLNDSPRKRFKTIARVIEKYL
jgi:hypothetical protein